MLQLASYLDSGNHIRAIILQSIMHTLYACCCTCQFYIAPLLEQTTRRHSKHESPEDIDDLRQWLANSKQNI